MAKNSRRVQWWIPLVGLAATGTLITGGFGQSIESAVESEAREALDAAGLESVSADASYRDLELSGVASLEESARAAVAGTNHLLDVTYEVEEKDDGHHDDDDHDHGHDDDHDHEGDKESPSPSVDEVACEALSLECMGVGEYLDWIIAERGTVSFAPDSAQLTQQGRDTVALLADDLIAVLEADPSLNFHVVGKTDSSIHGKGRERLSQQRADAMVSALIDEGVPAEALEAVGVGAAGATSSDSNRLAQLRVGPYPGK